MNDRDLIAIICSGWLSSKYSAQNNPKNTAKVAYTIAKEIVRLMDEDEMKKS